MSAGERLLNLVLAMLATDQGITKSALLTTVSGYAQDLEAGTSRATLDRRFERDKASLRSLGIAIEAIDDPSQPGNTQLTRYRIARESFSIPDDVDFSDDEVVMIGLAERLWAEQVASDSTSVLLDKLRGLGFDTKEMAHDLPAIVVAEPTIAPIQRAITDRLAIRFSYRTPEHASATRRWVLPAVLIRFGGRWHVRGLDLEARAWRTFLLRRIQGEVDAEPAPEQLDDATISDERARSLAELEAVWRRHLAVLWVREGSEADARLRSKPGTDRLAPDRLAVHYVEQDLFAEELCSFGGDVSVLAPITLRDTVADKLAAVAAWVEDDGGSAGARAR